MAKELMNIKRPTRDEKFQKNIKILRFYQRKVIDAQINLSRRKLIRLLSEKSDAVREEINKIVYNENYKKKVNK
jgi:hypothetical protein